MEENIQKWINTCAQLQIALSDTFSQMKSEMTQVQKQIVSQRQDIESEIKCLKAEIEKLKESSQVQVTNGKDLEPQISA